MFIVIVVIVGNFLLEIKVVNDSFSIKLRPVFKKIIKMFKESDSPETVNPPTYNVKKKSVDEETIKTIINQISKDTNIGIEFIEGKQVSLVNLEECLKLTTPVRKEQVFELLKKILIQLCYSK
jgi:hypothetical protein